MADLVDGVRVFKITTPDGSPCHGGNPEFRWPLPTATAPGDWIAVKGRLAFCDHPGLHVTKSPARQLNDQGGDPSELVCWEAEIDAKEKYLGGEGDEHKISARRVRLLRRVEWSDVGVYSEGLHDLSGNAQARLSDNAQATLSGNAQATSDYYHSASAVVALEHMAAHVDRRGGKLVLRAAEGAVS